MYFPRLSFVLNVREQAKVFYILINKRKRKSTLQRNLVIKSQILASEKIEGTQVGPDLRAASTLTRCVSELN